MALGAGASAGRRRQGANVRARVGHALGLDPVALLRRADEADRRVRDSREEAGWTAALYRLDLAHGEHDSLDAVRRAAAERGDRDAILWLAGTRDPSSGDQARVLAWLEPLVAADDLRALELLARWARDAAERDRVVARLLEAGRRRGDFAGCAALAFVWEERPGRRAEVEALVVALRRGWAARLIVEERGVARPGRPLLRFAAASYREESDPSLEGARGLHGVLRLDPSLLELLDLERIGVPYERAVELLSCPTDWTLPLAGLDLRPFAPRGPALEAAARGQWVAAWQLSTAALLVDPEDRDALRARGHALLAVARGDFVPPPELALRPVTGAPYTVPTLAIVLADEVFAHLGLPADAAGALDRALCDLHRQLGSLGLMTSEEAAFMAWYVAAAGFAEGDEARARALALHAAAAGASVADPAELAAARSALAAQLEAAESPDEATARARRRAASALRAAR